MLRNATLTERCHNAPGLCKESEQPEGNKEDRRGRREERREGGKEGGEEMR